MCSGSFRVGKDAMDAEDIRQLASYYLQDTGKSIDEFADQSGIDEPDLVDFLYGGRYVNDTIADEVKSFLESEYRKRDRAIMSTELDNEFN